MTVSENYLSNFAQKYGVTMSCLYSKNILVFYKDCGQCARIDAFDFVRLKERAIMRWLYSQAVDYERRWMSICEVSE